MFKHGKTKAVYAGSFDPITLGHLDIVSKALTVFDEVHIAIGSNPKKTRMFGVKESCLMIRDSILEMVAPLTWEDQKDHVKDRVSVGSFVGVSLLAYARSVEATHIVRGLRQASDFNDEFTLHGVADRIDPTIPMVHFICQERFLHVSSSTAKELASLSEDTSWLVTSNVEAALKKHFGGT